MSTSDQKVRAETPDIPEWMKRALECPVCLEIIMDTPIYQCENIQGQHSVCSACHESLQKRGKTCPLCRSIMMNRRNIAMECMVEHIPNKVKCKFGGCDFKRSDGELVKKHEEVCENRYVPCAYCDDKIGLKGLAEHNIKNHYNGIQFNNKNFGFCKRYYSSKGFLEKDQAIITITVEDDCQKFLLNSCTLDEASMLFWMAYIGTKDCTTSYKYTLQVGRSGTEMSRYLFEGTRHCVPCDLSHEEVKKRRCALMLDKELVDNATKDDDTLHFFVTIFKD